MNSKTIETILVGSFLALITAIINQIFAGKIDYLWVFGIFLFTILLFWLFYGTGFPFTKFRVTGTNDGKGLLFRSDISSGKKVGEAWQFLSDKSNWAIYGPYLRQPLHKGKYRATFRIKVDDISGDNRPIVDIDVASRCKEAGDKRLVGRTLTTRDFIESDEYHDCSLDFFVVSDENDLELRVFTRNSGHTITLDHIQLSRRLI